MREAGGIIRQIFSLIMPKVSVGLELSKIDEETERLLKNFGARSALKMLGFPANISISLNEQVIQGLPEGRIFSSGDLVSLDLTVYYKGYFVDKAVSFVLDPKHYVKRYIVGASKKCFEAALVWARPYTKPEHIGAVIEQQALSLKVRPCKEFFGHAIGESHHMKPLIPNYAMQSDDILREGDFITIEPIVFYDRYTLVHNGFDVYADQLSAHTEETILITERGPEVIT